MAYIDGFLLAVPQANKESYLALANMAAQVFKEHGALHVVECWEDDVPEGKHTSFPMAVKREPGEAIVFSWIWWPDKATRDRGNKTAMEDPRMQAYPKPMPFDSKRMIFGGFDLLVDH